MFNKLVTKIAVVFVTCWLTTPVSAQGLVAIVLDVVGPVAVEKGDIGIVTVWWPGVANSPEDCAITWSSVFLDVFTNSEAAVVGGGATFTGDLENSANPNDIVSALSTTSEFDEDSKIGIAIVARKADGADCSDVGGDARLQFTVEVLYSKKNDHRVVVGNKSMIVPEDFLDPP